MNDFVSKGNQHQSANNSFKAEQATPGQVPQLPINVWNDSVPGVSPTTAAQVPPVPGPVTNVPTPGLPPTTPGQVPAGQIAIKNVFMEPSTTTAAQVPLVPINVWNDLVPGSPPSNAAQAPPVPGPVTNVPITGLPPTVAQNYGIDPVDPLKHLREIMADRAAGRTPASQTVWSTPEPLEPDPLPEFPVQAVPDPLRSWIVAVSQYCQTPVELAGLCGLACCSAGIARNIAIDAGGWTEEATIFVNCVLESGNRKSSVVEQAREPILELEAEMLEASRPAIARAESRRKTLEEALKKAQQDAAKKNPMRHSNKPSSAPVNWPKSCPSWKTSRYHD